MKTLLITEGHNGLHWQEFGRQVTPASDFELLRIIGRVLSEKAPTSKQHGAGLTLLKLKTGYLTESGSGSLGSGRKIRN